MPALTVANLQGWPITAAPTTTTPSTTTSPGLLDPLSHDLTAANSVLLVVLEWAGIVALVVTFIWLLALRRRRQLVVSAFTNTSGLTELHTTAQGLGQLLRERLVEHLQLTSQQLRDSAERTSLAPTPQTLSDPVPIGTPDERVSQLVTSLTAFVPQSAGSAVQMLGDLFLRSAGTRVTGTVQGGGSGRVGITLELTDLGGHHAPSIETIWAPEAGDGGQQRAGRQAGPPKGLGKRLIALGDLAGRLPVSAQHSAKQAGVRQAAPANGSAQRVHALLDPAARLAARRVAALELLSAALQGGPERRRWSRQEREALVRNAIGMLLQGDAFTYSAQGLTRFFFGQAMREFNRAAETAPELYQPYENRADTAAMFGQYILEQQGTLPPQPDRWEADRLLISAIADYERALRQAQVLSNSKARAQVVHRLQIGLLLTQRRFNPLRVPVEVELIPTLETAAVSDKDDQFLYNLACWFGLDANLRQQAAIAAKQQLRWRRLPWQLPSIKPDPNDEAKALRYLAYSLARAITEKRAEGRARQALHDSDLQAIPNEKIRRLREAIAVERRRDPQLQDSFERPFADAIDRALTEV
jgi:hypothetical protein